MSKIYPALNFSDMKMSALELKFECARVIICMVLLVILSEKNFKRDLFWFLIDLSLDR